MVVAFMNLRIPYPAGRAYNIAMAFTHGKILVPIDHSDLSRQALATAVAVAGPFDARLLLLTVIEDRFPYPDMFSFENPEGDYYRVMKARAHDDLSALAAEYPALKERMELYITRGRPYDKIVEVAAAEKADLIVMGTHGVGGISHALLGSVAEKVLRHAPCPVLVVRQKDYERA